MANSTSHTLPYPIKGARFTLELAFRIAAGTPTDPTTPDTEFSTDGGATFADCAEEVTTGGANGVGYLTLTGAETNANLLAIAGKSANCVTTPAIIYPRVLASVGTGTLSAGSAGGGTLGTLLAYDVTGCFIQTTGGTGGGGTGGANNQARKIVTYNTGTGAFTVAPNWETTPDATTTYSVLLPEGVTLGMLRTLNPTSAGNTLDVAATGEAGLDFNNIKDAGGAHTLTNIRVPNVTLADTLTTYSGNTPQTGDAFVRIGANGAGLTALGDSRLANLDLAVSTVNNNVLGITSNSARTVIAFAAQMEIPVVSTTPYELDLLSYNVNGDSVDADALPTVAARDASGNSLNANLSSTTMTRIALGRYKVTYNLPSSTSAIPVLFDFSYLEGTEPRTITAVADVADKYSVDFTTSDRTKLNRLDTDYTTTRAAKLDNADVAVSTRLSTAGYTAPDNADIVTALNDLVALLARNSPLDAAGVRAAVGLALANLDSQLDALPTAAEVLTTFKADDDWQVMLADVNGNFTYNPATGVLVLKDKANVVTLATLHLTVDSNDVVTARSSS